MARIHDDSTPVVVTSYHRPKTFVKCLNSVLDATSNNVVVIDNSVGKLDLELQRYHHNSRVRIIKNPSNIGKPASINKHFESIGSGRWFITMDPDVIIPAGGIDRLIQQANNLVDDGYPIAIACPAIVNGDDGDDWDNQIKRRSMNMHYWSEMYEIEPNIYMNRSLAGCLMLVSTEFFKSIGMYSAEKLYNDDDGYLCYNSVIANMINVICSDVRCVHDNSENAGGYMEWKMRNFDKQVDTQGYWDQL